MSDGKLSRDVVLLHATTAFYRQKNMANDFAKHCKDCRICRSKVARFFFRCPEGENLEFEFRIARADADMHRDALGVMQLEMPPSPENTPAPTLVWLNNLYNMEDDR